MTEYEAGFAQGEAVAWQRRHDPLPPKGDIRSERDRGYWDARLPRSLEWVNKLSHPQRYREAA
jgi:hypothetical protein